MQSEINKLKRKLKDLDAPVVAKTEEVGLSTTKGYKKGRIRKDEEATLKKLEEFTIRIKNTDLGAHSFKNNDTLED